MLDGHTEELLVEIPRGRSITLELVDRHGSPVPYVHASLIDSDEFYEAVRGDESGTILIEGLPDAPLVLTLDSRRTGRKTGSHYAPPAPFEVIPNDQVERIELESAVLVEGRVVEEGGSDDLPRLYIEVTEAGSHLPNVVAALDGTFSFHARPGVELTLAVKGNHAGRGAVRLTQPSFSPYRGELHGVIAPASNVELVVSQPALDRSLTVVLVDPDGAPIPNVGVQVVAIGHDIIPVTSDDNGRAEFSGLPGVEAWIRVPVLPSLPDALVAPAAQRHRPDGQELTFEFQRGVLIHGRVFDKAGEPVEGAYVQGPSDTNDQFVVAQTQSDGRFAFALLPDSRVDLEVLWTTPGGGRRRETVDDVTVTSPEIVVRFGDE